MGGLPAPRANRPPTPERLARAHGTAAPVSVSGAPSLASTPVALADERSRGPNMGPPLFAKAWSKARSSIFERWSPRPVARPEQGVENG